MVYVVTSQGIDHYEADTVLHDLPPCAGLFAE